MRVELDFDLRPARPEPEVTPVVDPEVVAEKLRRYREDRFLRRVALAQAIEARIAAGEFQDLADAAQRCHVSRARLGKVVAWRE